MQRDIGMLADRIISVMIDWACEVRGLEGGQCGLTTARRVLFRQDAMTIIKYSLMII